METKAWPVEGQTVRLAHDQLAAPGEGGERLHKRPPTVDGEVNVGMDHVIHLPGLEQQKAGFTPYMTGGDGKPVDATRELLLQFPGIYKPVTAKAGPEPGTGEEQHD